MLPLLVPSKIRLTSLNIASHISPALSKTLSQKFTFCSKHQLHAEPFPEPHSAFHPALPQETSCFQLFSSDRTCLPALPKHCTDSSTSIPSRYHEARLFWECWALFPPPGAVTESYGRHQLIALGVCNSPCLHSSPAGEGHCEQGCSC